MTLSRRAILVLAVAGMAGAVALAQAQEQIFGSQMMTEQERREHRERMLKAKTAEERERIRAEHHQAMTARAKERGVTLPDEPPPRAGMGPPGGGMGMGRGMGPPAGAGPGRIQ